MKKSLVMAVLMGMVSTVMAQSNIIAASKNQTQAVVAQPITIQSYTDLDMEKMGLNEADITLYRSERETIKGQWWGHVSPVEFLIYSAQDKTERDRYAKLYLSSNLPKAVAEKDAMVSMYEMAREVFADQHDVVIKDTPNQSQKRPALFVDISCTHCTDPVVELINQSTMKVDVYFTGLAPQDDPSAHQTAMVEWAKALNLKPEQITLNNDNGIYEKLNNQPLVDFHLMTP